MKGVRLAWINCTTRSNFAKSLALRSAAGGVLSLMFPSTRDEVDQMGATSSSVNSSDSPRTVQSYMRLALVGLLAWLAWSAFRDELGYVPLLSDIDLAIHEFGHMLFMPFGIQFLGNTMMILGGSLTQVAFPLIFFGYFMRKHDDAPRRDLFAAMVCLWWSAIGLLATAIYCGLRKGELFGLRWSSVHLDAARVERPPIQTLEVRRVGAHATVLRGRQSGCSSMKSAARRRSFGVLTVSQTPSCR